MATKLAVPTQGPPPYEFLLEVPDVRIRVPQILRGFDEPHLPMKAWREDPVGGVVDKSFRHLVVQNAPPILAAEPLLLACYEIAPVPERSLWVPDHAHIEKKLSSRHLFDEGTVSRILIELFRRQATAVTPGLLDGRHMNLIYMEDAVVRVNWIEREGSRMGAWHLRVYSKADTPCSAGTRIIVRVTP